MTEADSWTVLYLCNLQSLRTHALVHIAVWVLTATAAQEKLYALVMQAITWYQRLGVLVSLMTYILHIYSDERT